MGVTHEPETGRLNLWSAAGFLFILAAVAFGSASAAAWLIGNADVRIFMSQQIKFRTSVALSSLALSLLFATRAEPTPLTQRLQQMFAYATLLISACALVMSFGGTDLLRWFDHVFSLDSAAHGSAGIKPNTVFCFIILAGASLSLNLKTWSHFLFQRLTIASGCVGLFGVSSFLFKRIGFTDVAAFTEMNLYPAITFFLLSVAVLFRQPNVGLNKIVSNKKPSGVFARRMMVAACLCPPILGWLGMLAVEGEIFTSATAWALVSLLSITLFASLVWQSAETMRSAEEILFDRELHFRSMASTIPQLVWTCDATGHCDYLSKQWLEYTGMQEQQQLGHGWLECVIHPDDKERTFGHWKGAVAEHHVYDIEYRIRRADGAFRWFKTRAIPLRDRAGKILSWVGTCTDVHDQKLAAEELVEAKLNAERANSSKTQFLANMSHEIRTPIGAIMGFTELLKNPGNSEADKRTFMQIIARNSHNLLRLIDDILDLSKVESGKISVERCAFNLTELLSDFRAANDLKASEKNVAFVVTFEGVVPDQVSTDALRLKQILSNVVGNALKFTDQGEVVLNVKYCAPNLIFTVSDTGPGLSLDAQLRLFQSFSQADPTLTRKYGGTGLGLVLSKRLSQFLGGDLVLTRSEPHIGSTFTATIQVDAVPSANLVGVESIGPVQPRARAASSGERLRGLNVLVVDDSPDNRTLIKTYLKKTGALVEMAEDGVDGFEKALAFQPHVILMDVQMPRLDGRSATKKLREAGYHRPIIALTAHAMREERDRCFEAGCTDYLTKPILRDLLIDTLAKHAPPSGLAHSGIPLSSREPSQASH